MGRRAPPVGRAREVQQLLQRLEAAAGGVPSATLVHGEAGVGKTTIVRSVFDPAHEAAFHTLFGQCLLFGADVTSYVPFSRALHQWFQAATEHDRTQVLPGVRSCPA